MARDPADIAQDRGRDGLTRSFDASKPYRSNGVHPPIEGAKGRVAETAAEILELIQPHNSWKNRRQKGHGSLIPTSRTKRSRYSPAMAA